MLTDITEKDIQAVVKKVMDEIAGNGGSVKLENIADKVKNVVANDGILADLTAVDLRDEIKVPFPANEEIFRKLKSTTAARIGVWRAGPRYRTETMLRLRADHAAAMDAVFNDVSADFLQSLGAFAIQTKCESRDEFLTKPDLGRVFAAETLAELQKRCVKNPDVQIYLADGLSSSAIEANAAEVLPAIIQGLKNKNISVGTVFFAKYARVPSMEQIAETLGAKVTIALIGERPGLATAKSMSAYIAYDAKVGMPEAKRTVISNIHDDGIPAAEAGAYIADLAATMLQQKASGMDLK